MCPVRVAVRHENPMAVFLLRQSPCCYLPTSLGAPQHAPITKHALGGTKVPIILSQALRLLAVTGHIVGHIRTDLANLQADEDMECVSGQPRGQQDIDELGSALTA